MQALVIEGFGRTFLAMRTSLPIAGLVLGSLAGAALATSARADALGSAEGAGRMRFMASSVADLPPRAAPRRGVVIGQEEKERELGAEAKRRASKAAFDRFAAKNRVAGLPAYDEVRANPQAFAGQRIGLRATFDKMIDGDTALFLAGPLSPMVVHGVPSSLFTKQQGALLAVTVNGRGSVHYPIRGRVDALEFNFVDALPCSDERCDDFLYWTDHPPLS
jgi:hypothetical protein